MVSYWFRSAVCVQQNNFRLEEWSGYNHDNSMTMALLHGSLFMGPKGNLPQTVRILMSSPDKTKF